MGYEFINGPHDAWLENAYKGLYGTKISGGKGARYDKNLLEKFNAGADTSDYGQLQGIRSLHAANRRSIGDDYGYGGNALLAANGTGEQANILQRMKEGALDRDMEREGQETGQAVSDLYNSTSDRFQQNRLQRKGMELGAKQAGASGYADYLKYRNPMVYKKGWLDNFTQLLGALGQGAQGAGAIMAGM